MSRYSQLYIERGRPEPDSERARIRLFAIYRRLCPQYLWGITIETIRERTGISLYEPRIEQVLSHLFLQSPIRDILDSVTVIRDVLGKPGENSKNSQDWLYEANRVFEEENLGYRVGDDGIVHPFVDEEFEVNRACALKALSDPRFGEARNDFEAAYHHLRNGNGKEALRMMFPAVEVAARVLFPGAFARLTPNEVDRHIAPRMRAGTLAISRRSTQEASSWVGA